MYNLVIECGFQTDCYKDFQLSNNGSIKWHLSRGVQDRSHPNGNYLRAYVASVSLHFIIARKRGFSDADNFRFCHENGF